MSRPLLVLLLLCATLVVTAPVSASEPTEAELDQAAGWYAEGKAAYKAGRYAEAATLFERAATVTDDPVLLWNMGRSQEKAGQLEKARLTYRDLLARRDLPPKIRARGADDLVRVELALREQETSPGRAERERQLSGELEEARKADTEARIAELQREMDKLHLERLSAAERAAEHRDDIGRELDGLRLELERARNRRDGNEVARLRARVAEVEGELRHADADLAGRRLALGRERDDAQAALTDARTAGDEVREQTAEARLRQIDALLAALEVDASAGRSTVASHRTASSSQTGQSGGGGGMGWTFLGLGGLAAVTGAIMVGVAETNRDKVEGAIHDAGGFTATKMTRARALRLQEAADTEATVGIALLVVGVAGMVGGVVMALSDGSDDADTAFGVAPIPGGVSVGAATTF